MRCAILKTPWKAWRNLWWIVYMNCQPIYLLWRSSWSWPCWSTFTPQVVRANPPRPTTTDDLERDRVLSQRIALFGWVDEKNPDIPEGEESNGFLMFAQQGSSSIYHFLCTKLSWFSPELLKINHYKAFRDKLICMLNYCKVIFGLLFTSSLSRVKLTSIRLDSPPAQWWGGRFIYSDHLCGSQSEPGASAF